jgi:hypothetical protein
MVRERTCCDTMRRANEMAVLDPPGTEPSVEFDTSKGPSETRLCPGCGLPERFWKENSGRGHLHADGQSFCCRGCAEQTGCTCV